MTQLSIQIKNHYNFNISVKVIFKNGKIEQYQGFITNPPASFWDPRKEYTNSNFEHLICDIGTALENSIEEKEKV